MTEGLVTLTIGRHQKQPFTTEFIAIHNKMVFNPFKKVTKAIKIFFPGNEIVSKEEKNLPTLLAAENVISSTNREPSEPYFEERPKKVIKEKLIESEKTDDLTEKNNKYSEKTPTSLIKLQGNRHENISLPHRRPSQANLPARNDENKNESPSPLRPDLSANQQDDPSSFSEASNRKNENKPSHLQDPLCKEKVLGINLSQNRQTSTTSESITEVSAIPDIAEQLKGLSDQKKDSTVPINPIPNNPISQKFDTTGYSLHPPHHYRNPPVRNVIVRFISQIWKGALILLAWLVCLILIDKFLRNDEAKNTFESMRAYVKPLLEQVPFYTTLGLSIGVGFFRRHSFVTLVKKELRQQLMNAIKAFAHSITPGKEHVLEYYSFLLTCLANLTLRKISKSFENLYPIRYILTALYITNEQKIPKYLSNNNKTLIYRVEQEVRDLHYFYSTDLIGNGNAVDKLMEWSSDVIDTVKNSQPPLFFNLGWWLVQIYGVLVVFVQFPCPLLGLVNYVVFQFCLQLGLSRPNDINMFCEIVTRKFFKKFFLTPKKRFVRNFLFRLAYPFSGRFTSEDQMAHRSLVANHPLDSCSSSEDETENMETGGEEFWNTA